jgi:hypothetical protein
MVAPQKMMPENRRAWAYWTPRGTKKQLGRGGGFEWKQKGRLNSNRVFFEKSAEILD